MSPAGTLCFDIFSPPSGDSDVISQVERLSSNEMNIAPRSLRLALGASGRSAIICMAVSRVGDRNLTLPERRSLSTSPWDLEAEILALRHQLTVLRRKAPKRLAFSSFDRLFFASLYRIAPGVVNALVIVKPETVIRWHRAGFRLFWRWKSRHRGGPKVPLEIRQLIRALSLANPLWGAPRIHGELVKPWSANTWQGTGDPIPPQPRRWDCIDGPLCGSDTLVSAALWLADSKPRPASDPMGRRDGTPDRRMDCPAAHRSLRLGMDTEVYRPRS